MAMTKCCSKKAFASYQMDTPLQLTATAQLVTGWEALITPRRFSVSDGAFTATRSGTYQIILERIYTNLDQNPSDIVNITIDVKKNGETAFTRTYSIMSAISPSEPSIDPFTTPILLEIKANDVFEVYVSAEDDDLDPDSTYLSLIKITATKEYD